MDRGLFGRAEHSAHVSVGIICALLGCLAPGCADSEKTAPPTVSAARSEMPDQVFDGFELTVTDNGVRKGWVTADQASKYGERKIFDARGLRVIFYTPTGQVNSILTSHRGIIHIDSGNMEAMDSVVVYSADSSRILLTERLLWKKTENQIVSDTTVTVKSERGVVHGDGMVSDAGFRDLEVKNPTGDINVLRQ